MKRVIIVDDEPITRMDLSDMLRELGFDVAGEAADGFDAIELCREKNPDVVLMDVKMPVFDGLTASETILSEDLARCVVLLTAFSDRDIIARASKAGVTGYLLKPIDQRSLLPTIEVAYEQSCRLLEARREASEAQQRIREDRMIHKAQLHLAKTQGCSESEAYRQMRKLAMDKRLSMAVLAQRILEQASRTDEVEAAKALMTKLRGIPGDKAYRKIVSLAKVRGCTTEEAARQIRLELSREV